MILFVFQFYFVNLCSLFSIHCVSKVLCTWVCLDAISRPLNYNHCIHLIQPIYVYLCARQVNYVRCVPFYLYFCLAVISFIANAFEEGEEEEEGGGEKKFKYV